jgi:hypothetical protein
MLDLPIQTLDELLNQIGQRNDQAVTRLYRHYHGFLYAYIRHRLADWVFRSIVTGHSGLS